MENLFFGRKWHDVDYKAGLKRKYDIKAKEAETARMQAGTEAATAERRYGHGSEAYGGLMGEELARRFPYGLPAQEAKTARMTAKSTASYYGRAAGVEERGVTIKEKQEEFARKYLTEHGMLPSQAGVSGSVSKIKAIAEEDEETVAAPTSRKCGRGYYWNGQKCVPNLMVD